jgi:hypothetical protein
MNIEQMKVIDCFESKSKRLVIWLFVDRVVGGCILPLSNVKRPEELTRRRHDILTAPSFIISSPLRGSDLLDRIGASAGAGNCRHESSAHGRDAITCPE